MVVNKPLEEKIKYTLDFYNLKHANKVKYIRLLLETKAVNKKEIIEKAYQKVRTHHYVKPHLTREEVKRKNIVVKAYIYNVYERLGVTLPIKNSIRNFVSSSKVKFITTRGVLIAFAAKILPSEAVENLREYSTTQLAEILFDADVVKP